MFRIFILMTAVLTFSCADKKAPSTSDKVDSVKVSYSQNVVAADSSEKEKDYTPTNNFAARPFLIEPSIELLSKVEKYKIEKESKLNIHEKGVVDTVVRCRSGQDYFVFYKAKHATFLTDAIVTSKEIAIKNAIDMGMSIEDVKSRLKGLVFNVSDNSIEVETLGGYAKTRFEFDGSGLVKVVYTGYLD